VKLDLFTAKAPPLFGLDISSSSVKMVEIVDAGKGIYRVERYAIESLGRDAVVDGNINNLEAVTDSVRRAYKRLGILIISVSLIAYILIAATFAPSIYGQSYPIARARFAGRMLMTGALMINGALLGILAANVRMKLLRSTYFRRFAILALMLLVLYPLRGVWRTSTEIPVYKQRAAAWDLRDSEIRALEARGVQDLVVRFLPDEKLQDLGDHTGFRLNRCASIIYGVNSILAVPMEDE